MRGIIRPLMALLTVAVLLLSAVLALFGLVTSGEFIRLTSTQALRDMQQARIEQTADELTAAWGLSPQTLTACVQDAAERYGAALAAWWTALWCDAEADPLLPLYIDDAQERELVQAVKADAGFKAAAPEGQEHAIARDEIVYELDEAVCDAVLPLRRSIVELVTETAAGYLNLPMLRRAALLGAGALAGLALLLLLVMHRSAGSILVTAALSMGLLSVPVWLLDLCGMMQQLNLLAAEQLRCILLCTGICWYATAAALALLGLIVLAVKGAVRRGRA